MPSYLGQTVDQSFLDMLTTVYKGGYVAMHPAHLPPVESDATLISQMEAALVRGGPDADLLARQLFFIGPAPADYAARVKADGASAYWRLGETSGTTAVDIIGGKHGTISGGVTLGQAGPVADGDKAMAFDGVDDRVRAPTGAYQTFGTGPLTIEFWAYLPSLAPVASNRYLVDCRNAGGGTGLQFYYDNLYLILLAQDTLGTITTVLKGGSTVIGQWRHIVGVVSRGASDKLALYVDAVLAQEVTFTNTGRSLTSTLGTGIGCPSAYNDAANHAVATLDDVAIYKVALTPAQITAHYNARLQSSSYQRLIAADDAVAHWPLDETSGLTAFNAVSGGPNGTISGGVTLGVAGPISGGRAMSFNGTTGKIAVPTGAYQTFGTGGLSLEAWVRIAVAPGADVAHHIVDCGPGSGFIGVLLYLWSIDPDMIVMAKDTTSATHSLNPAGTAPANGAWRHYVAVLQRGATDTLAIFVNGTSAGTLAIPAGRDFTATQGMGIANRATAGGTTWFAGDVAHVAIYKVALTPAQIKAHYDARLPRTVY